MRTPSSVTGSALASFAQLRLVRRLAARARSRVRRDLRVDRLGIDRSSRSSRRESRARRRQLADVASRKPDDRGQPERARENRDVRRARAGIGRDRRDRVAIELHREARRQIVRDENRVRALRDVDRIVIGRVRAGSTARECGRR